MFAAAELPLTATASTVRVEATPLDVVDGAGVSVSALETATLTRARDLGQPLGDILDEVAGARVQDLGGPGAVRRLSLRGAAPSQTLLVLDGVPLRMPFATGFDLDLFPASSLDRVRVARSGLGAVLGAGALAGAVLLDTRVGRKGNFSVEVGGGSFGTTRLAAHGTAPGFSVSATLRRTSADFEFDDVAPGLPPESRRRRNADATRLGFVASGTGRAGGFELDGRVFLTSREAGTPGFSSTPNLFARERRGLFFGALGLRRDLGRIQFSARLSASHQDLDTFDASPGTGVDRKVDFDSLDGQVGLTFLGGRDVRRIEVAVSEARAEGVLRGARRQVSARGSEEWFVTDSLSLFAAVALEAASDQGSWALPRLGLRWSADALQLDLSAGRSLRLPTLDELFRPPEPGLVGNPGLVAETSWDGEGSVAWSGRHFEARGAVFGRVIEDPILYLNRNAFEVRPENLDRSWALGAEVEAEGSLWLGPVRLSARMAGTLIEARLEATGERLPAQPVWTGFFRGTARWGRVELASRVRLAGPTQTRLRAAPDNEVPTYARWDVSLRAALPAGFRLGLRVDNVLDDRGLRTLNKLPLPGRTGFLGLSWQRREPE